MTQLLVGVHGCFDAPWAPSLPEDLPAQWRAGYLANELDALSVTVQELETARERLFEGDPQDLLESLDDWLDDPPEQPDAEQPDAEQQRPRGLILDGELARLPWWPRRDAQGDLHWLEQDAVLRMPAADAVELSVLRARIEAFVSQHPAICALILDGEQALEQARQATLLRDLMGL